MPRFWRIVCWNVVASVRWWHLWAILLLFLFIGWQGARQVAAAALIPSDPIAISVWDGVFVGFAGPALSDNSLLTFLRWLVPHLLFCYMIGDLANGELIQRGHAVVPAIGSRQIWWWGKIALLGLITLSYTIIGVSAALLGASIVLPWSADWSGGIFALAGWSTPMPFPTSGATLVSWIMILLTGTLFAFAMWQTTLALLLRRSIYGLIAMLSVAICSWLLGSHQAELVRWLPGSQSMLLRHSFWNSEIPAFSLQWSPITSFLLSLRWR